MSSPRPYSPAERCIRAIAANLMAFLLIVGGFVGGAAIVTARQPVLYASRVLVSVRPPAEVLAEALRTKRPYLGPDGHIYDANDPERQSGPGRYAPRLVAPGLVTAAAHDAGLLSSEAVLDDQETARVATAERIEGADLVRLTVWQPSGEAAQKLAAAIVARGLAANERDEASVEPLELKRVMTIVDSPTRPSSPSYPRRSVNLSVGFGLGVLAASAFVAIRSALR